MTWTLVYTSQARRDAKKVVRSGLKEKVEELLDILRRDPYQDPPPYERLRGDLQSAISRRINIQHRLVYDVIEHLKTVKIIRMWTHYQ